MAKRKAQDKLIDPESSKRAEKQFPKDTGEGFLSQEPVKNTSLLELPAELRNAIWRLVLVEQDMIKVHPNVDATQPGLLRTNQQVRKEARPIYCEENRFQVTVRDFKYEPHDGHWVWNRGGGDQAAIRMGGQYSWINLKAWLRAYRDDQAYGLGEAGVNLKPDLMLATQAFEVVRTLGEAGVPWEVVEKTLELMKKAVSAVPGSGWTD